MWSAATVCVSAGEPDPASLWEHGVDLARDGRYAEALDTLHRAAGVVSNAVPVRADIVVVHSWQGTHDAAVRAYDRLPADYVAPAYVLRAVARSMRATGQNLRALQACDRILAVSPEHAAAINLRARLLAAMGCAGVDGALTDASIRYRLNEGFAARIAASRNDLEDGNRSDMLLFGAEKALWTRSAIQSRLYAEAVYETQSATNVPYFSPDKATTWEIMHRLDHTLYRRYDLPARRTEEHHTRAVQVDLDLIYDASPARSTRRCCAARIPKRGSRRTTPMCWSAMTAWW